MMHLKSALCAAAVVALVACADNEPRPTVPSHARGPRPAGDMYGTTMRQPSSPAPMGDMSAPRPARPDSGPEGVARSQGTGMTPASAEPPTTTAMSPASDGMEVSGFTDGQLAAVIVALNDQEIEESQLATTKASSKDVRAFARDMVAAHRDMLNASKALFDKLHVTAADNAVSSKLKTATLNQMTTLEEQTRGYDFDDNYVDAQVRAHNTALDLIDRMILDASSPDLKAALQEDLSKVDAHLQAAAHLQDTLKARKVSTPAIH